MAIFNFIDNSAKRKREEDERNRVAAAKLKQTEGLRNILAKQIGIPEGDELGPNMPEMSGLLRQEGLDRQTVLSGLLNAGGYNTQVANSLLSGMAPKENKPMPGAVGQFTLAKENKYIPEGTTFEKYLGMIKQGGVEVNIGGDNNPYKLPAGMMLKNKDDWYQGVVPIPGSKGEKTNVTDAGKVQMMRIAKDKLDLINTLIWEVDGSVNYKNIGLAAINAPRTIGRQLAAAFEVGIQAITRLETGATMKDEELKNTRKRFQPSVFDDEATIIMKLEMYEAFISGSLKLIDPSGQFDTAKFTMELDSRKRALASKNKTVDFSGLKP